MSKVKKKRKGVMTKMKIRRITVMRDMSRTRMNQKLMKRG